MAIYKLELDLTFFFAFIFHLSLEILIPVIESRSWY